MGNVSLAMVVVCLIEVLVEKDKVAVVMNEVGLVSRVMKTDPNVDDPSGLRIVSSVLNIVSRMLL
jgi:hypothetical protein